jgi:phage terminase small subunit
MHKARNAAIMAQKGKLLHTKKEPLSAKHRLFIEHYLGDACGNPQKAAQLAGFAKSYSYVLLHDLAIRAEIERLINNSDAVLTREQLQTLWSRMALDPKLSVRDRLRATELLAKSRGEFLDKRLVVADIKAMPDDELQRYAGEIIEREKTKSKPTIGIKPEENDDAL